MAPPRVLSEKRPPNRTLQFVQRFPKGERRTLRLRRGDVVEDVPIPLTDGIHNLAVDHGMAIEIEQLSYEPSRRPSVDDGPALLEVITIEEYRATEGVLGSWEALDRHELSTVQQAQIIAMAELISSERNDTTPGETKRYRLVGS